MERAVGGALLERLPRSVRLTPMGRAMLPHACAAVANAERAAGEADLAIGPPPPDWQGTVEDLGAEEFVVVLPRDDPAVVVNGVTQLPLHALADRHWVHYAPGHGLADVLDHACIAAGFQPMAAVRTEQTATAPLLATAGLGPTLTPANVIPPRFDGRVLRPDPPIRRTLAAYTRDQPDPLTAAFIELLARKASTIPTHVRRQLHIGAAHT